MDTVKKIYESPDLPGECLVHPLKAWHGFLVKKIDQGSCLSSLAWRILYVVHIPLGMIAAVGMFIKLFGIPFVRNHNERHITHLNVVRDGIKCASEFGDTSVSSGEAAGYTLRNQQEFALTKQTVDQQYKEVVNTLRGSYRYLYLATAGIADEQNSPITLQLRVLEPIPVQA